MTACRRNVCRMPGSGKDTSSKCHAGFQLMEGFAGCIKRSIQQEFSKALRGNTLDSGSLLPPSYCSWLRPKEENLGNCSKSCHTEKKRCLNWICIIWSCKQAMRETTCQAHQPPCHLSTCLIATSLLFGLCGAHCCSPEWMHRSATPYPSLSLQKAEDAPLWQQRHR